ncbi:MAG: type II secretion system protein [Candidatus Omnitrophota bacterium]
MKKNKAFTLAELAISLVIISICVFSVALMYQQASYGSFNTQVITVATGLAEETMEETLRLGYAGINSSSPVNFPAPFDSYSRQVAVHYVNPANLDAYVDPLQTEYKRVEVTVLHNAVAVATLTSLVTNYTG